MLFLFCYFLKLTIVNYKQPHLVKVNFTVIFFFIIFWRGYFRKTYINVTWQTVLALKEQSHVTFLVIRSPKIFSLPNPLSPLQERCVTFQSKLSTLSDIVCSNFTAII